MPKLTSECESEMSFLNPHQCCVTSRKEILASNLLKLSKNKIKANVSSLIPATSHMNWSQISCWSNLNPGDSTSISLINTNQNEHVVLHVMSHDSFQLSMLLPSLWHPTTSSYLNQHGVLKKLLAWRVEFSFWHNSFDILQPKQKSLSSNRVWKNRRLQTALFINSSASWILLQKWLNMRVSFVDLMHTLSHARDERG